MREFLNQQRGKSQFTQTFSQNNEWGGKVQKSSPACEFSFLILKRPALYSPGLVMLLMCAYGACLAWGPWVLSCFGTEDDLVDHPGHRLRSLMGRGRKVGRRDGCETKCRHRGNGGWRARALLHSC